ncbi:MAG: dihydrolipoyl dehydrogenase [Deltaproteobacteria bacterium]|nr:dihydrolipoyl dehydrogenase [Deltaproteobacteria bacterium]
MNDFDVVILGGGPGGYVAAVRASQLGLKVALIEKEHLGGVCLNWGCIPTKSLLRNAEVIHLLSKGKAFGFKFDNLSVDYGEAHKRSRSVATRQTRRIGILMKNHHIGVYNGVGRLVSAHEVEIKPSGEKLTAKNIIVATGAGPRHLPGYPFDGGRVINYRTALDLREVPSSAVIVGAGPIGMEFATLWSRYGSKITVVEMMPHVLPNEDQDISVEAERQFRRVGIDVKTGARVEGISVEKSGATVTIVEGEKREAISVQKVLVAIGFAPNSENIGLEKIGVGMKRGHPDIDYRMATAVPNIYAIGDVTGKLGLAHVASAQGMLAAEAIAGRPTHALNYVKIPRCTYAYPEVASVGLSEKQAREMGYEVETAQCPFAANGKALAMDDNFGFAKIIEETKEKKILGVHLIGAHVTELIAGPSGMISLERTVEELAQTVHPHPTISEAIMEAAQALAGRAIHIG